MNAPSPLPSPLIDGPLIEARHLTVFRGERLVLDDVSLSVGQGEAVILQGPNGAGKSTLLRTLAGLRAPDSGTVERGSALAWLGHQDALKPGLTLTENLALAARLGGGGLDDALDALDLAPLRDLPARLLSSGQKRRAAFARVLLARAPLWLLDEPSVGMDAASVERLGALMETHRAQGGGIIVTTHVPLPVGAARTHTLAVLTAAEEAPFAA